MHTAWLSGVFFAISYKIDANYPKNNTLQSQVPSQNVYLTAKSAQEASRMNI